MNSGSSGTVLSALYQHPLLLQFLHHPLQLGACRTKKPFFRPDMHQKNGSFVFILLYLFHGDGDLLAVHVPFLRNREIFPLCQLLRKYFSCDGIFVAGGDLCQLLIAVH